MSAQHTPGPWFVVAQNNVGSKGTQVWGLAGDTRIADCASGGISLEGKRANARLIAAAPELLEALQGVLRVADRKTDEFDAARAAIDRATCSAAAKG